MNHINKVNISYTRLGITGGITNKKYPVKLALSTGAGLANIEASLTMSDNSGYKFNKNN